MPKSKGASAQKFRLITNPHPVSGIPASLEKFEINRRPDLGEKYSWELRQARWRELDEEAIEEISEVIWDVAEIVERAEARALRRRLQIVKPAQIVARASVSGSKASQSAAIQ